MVQVYFFIKLLGNQAFSRNNTRVKQCKIKTLKIVVEGFQVTLWNITIKITLKSGSHLPKEFVLFGKPVKNDEKCFLFHLKSSFHSQDI